ncbi:MAG: glycoside hydrolase family 95-like protein [Rubripirellula sp.]
MVGIAEMLLQSLLDEVHLLPVLPPQWPSGWVNGLRVRGGLEVNIAWNDGRLSEAKVRSLAGNLLMVRTGEQTH